MTTPSGAAVRNYDCVRCSAGRRQRRPVVGWPVGEPPAGSRLMASTAPLPSLALHLGLDGESRGVADRDDAHRNRRVLALDHPQLEIAGRRRARPRRATAPPRRSRRRRRRDSSTSLPSAASEATSRVCGAAAGGLSRARRYRARRRRAPPRPGRARRRGSTTGPAAPACRRGCRRSQTAGGRARPSPTAGGSTG